MQLLYWNRSYTEDVCETDWACVIGQIKYESGVIGK